jgi:hypothetical protein
LLLLFIKKKKKNSLALCARELSIKVKENFITRLYQDKKENSKLQGEAAALH